LVGLNVSCLLVAYPSDADVSDGPAGRIEQAYRDQSARLLRAVYAYARDRTVAEDAVAEAYTQAFRREAEIHDVDAWVWRTAFRLASRELGERRRVGAAPSEDGYEMDDNALVLMDALGMLSPKQRASVVLYHYAGFSAREIAEITGSTAGAVRVHLSVGRRRLREILEVPGG
jgi:RNA polymerase sigma factor (sigma-70 family)